MPVSTASILLFLLALPLASQSPRPLAPGDVVRWQREGRRTEGMVLAFVAGDAILRVMPNDGDTPLDLAWAAPGLQVRLSRGRRNKGMLLGAGVAAAVGVVVGLASGSDEPGWFAMSASDKAIGAGFLLALLGAPIGAIAAPGAQWADVAPRPETSRLGWYAGPQRIGVRLAF